MNGLILPICRVASVRVYVCSLFSRIDDRKVLVSALSKDLNHCAVMPNKGGSLPRGRRDKHTSHSFNLTHQYNHPTEDKLVSAAHCKLVFFLFLSLFLVSRTHMFFTFHVNLQVR